MKKIESFQVNHLVLKRGLYLSRRDSVSNGTVSTFDIRMKAPNVESVMSTSVMHTLEHLGATYLRSHPVWGEKTVYFGPMGCRTGFYVLFDGVLEPMDVAEVIRGLFAFAAEFEGEVPGADPKECGNYSDMDLESAKAEASKYLNEVLLSLNEENTKYAE